MPDDLSNAINLLLAAGRASAVPTLAANSDNPFALVPKDYTIFDLEKFLNHPTRVRASVKVLDPDSFVEYYSSFADDASRIFADERTCTIVGILDYHAADTPEWSTHKVTLELQKSPEWGTWTGSNNNQMSQTVFAEFLEQNDLDITQPDPATMMEVARDLEAHSEVEFRSGAKIQNGQIRLQYSETTTGKIANSTMEVPERFTIGIPVFVGGARVPMQAYLRYRIKDGDLTLHYTLVRPETVIRDAFLGAKDAIQAKGTGHILNGSPA